MTQIKSFLGFIALLAVVAAATFGWSYVDKLAALAESNARLTHQLVLANANALASKQMIERRNDAIGSSKCKAQIDYWLHHPDEIPTKFDPFAQDQK